MDAKTAKHAIRLAVDEDPAFRAALEGASELTIAEDDNGTFTLTAGEEVMEIDAETLMEAMEEMEMPERGSYPPPPPAGAVNE